MLYVPHGAGAYETGTMELEPMGRTMNASLSRGENQRYTHKQLKIL